MSLATSGLPTVTTLAAGDKFMGVKVSDTTTSPAGAGGSNKQITAKDAAVTFASLGLGIAIVPAATGTYSTDNANSAAAITAAGVGGTVYWPPGTYLVSELTPLSGQTWYGPAVLKWGSGTAETHVISATGITGWKMRDLVVDGNESANTSTFTPLVELINSVRCTLEGVEFQNANNSAGVASLMFHGTVRCKALECDFDGVGYGVVVGLNVGDSYSCYGNVIRNCTIDTTQWDAVFITENLASDTEGSVAGNVQSTVVEGCIIRNHGDGAVECGSGSWNTTVTGCTITGSGSTSNAGIYVRDSVICSVTGCSITGMSKSGSSGILVFDLNTFSKNVSVTGGSISNCFYGIQAIGSESDNGSVNAALTDLTITGVSVTGCGFGMYLGPVNRFSITGCTVSFNSQQGIQLGGFDVTGSGCTNGTITGNTVMSNGTSGSGGCGIVLLQACANVTIKGNRVGDDQTTKLQGYGIRIFDSSAVSIVVEGNDLTNGGVTANFNCNFTPASSNKISVSRNLGWNPQGAKSVTPGTSPWTYTAGIYPEVLYLRAGTISAVAKNSITIFAATGVAVSLEPNEPVTVTYSSTPTAVTDQK